MTSISTDPRIGSELLGYRIEAVLGRGGMGVVYRAYDPRLKRSVALKLVAPELAGDSRFRERFLAESELAASLEHPNVVPIHDAGELDGQLYLAMRYVAGSDLKTVLAEEGPLEPKRALAICAQVAGALDAAHARGLVHRDVKPSNVLLDEAEHVYLADFGLTRRIAEPGFGVGQSLGTPAYAAPEQIQGEEVDGRADVYSLGCVLYECLSGEPPYRRDSELATLWAQLHDPPPRLAAYPALDPMLAKALAKDPDERYPSCRELAETAAEALGIRDVVVVRDRRPLVLATLGALAATGAVAAGLALSLGGGGGPPRPSTKPTPAPRTDALQRIDPRTNKLAATIKVNSNPSAVAVGDGKVWVASEEEQAVSRIDPKTNEVTGTVSLSAPVGFAVGNGTVWVANVDTGTLTELDPATLAIASTVPNSAFCCPAFGEGGVWALGANGLTRINREGTVAASNPRAGLDPFAVTLGYGAVWVLDDIPLYESSVWRVDPATDKVVRRTRLAFDASGIAAGSGAVWITDNSGDLLAQIDPATSRIARLIRVGHGPVGVAVGEGSVWVTNYRDGTVSRIDPRRGTVVATINVGREPANISAGAQGVWVTVRAS